MGMHNLILVVGNQSLALLRSFPQEKISLQSVIMCMGSDYMKKWIISSLAVFALMVCAIVLVNIPLINNQL